MAPVKAKRPARVPRPWRQSANPCGRDHVVCYEPTRSPVLILRPFRSWTISSVRPGHRPALSTPMFPANAGRPGGCLSRGRPPSSPPPPNTHTLWRPSVPLLERVPMRQCGRRGREEDAGRGDRLQRPGPAPSRRTLPGSASGASSVAQACSAICRPSGKTRRPCEPRQPPASLRATHTLSLCLPHSLPNLSFPLLPSSPPPPPVSPLCTSHHSQR